MSHPTTRALRVLTALLIPFALACASPTAPTTSRSRGLTPATGAAFDDLVPPPTDTTCRSGYPVSQGHTC